MSMNIRFPNITGVSEAEQIAQIKSYLYQLVEQLNWMLPTIEMGAGQSGASRTGPAFGDISAETFYELKSLLIQSSDTLNAYYDKINAKLEGQYVSQADFGGYKQEIVQHFADLGSQYVAQTAFDTFKQENDGVISGLDSKYVSRTDNDAYKQEVSEVIADLQQSVSDLQQSVDELRQIINSMQETGG